MTVQIGGGAKALDQGDGAGVGCAAFDSRLFEQKAGNDAVDHLQYRREQLRVGGEQDAQWDRIGMLGKVMPERLSRHTLPWPAPELVLA